MKTGMRRVLQCKGGRTRADKIGVGAGGDIGGTDISCICMVRQYTGPTRRSYRDDHRHAGDPLDKYAGMVRRAGAHSS
jgi:hypothetical protein